MYSVLMFAIVAALALMALSLVTLIVGESIRMIRHIAQGRPSATQRGFRP